MHALTREAKGYFEPSFDPYDPTSPLDSISKKFHDFYIENQTAENRWQTTFMDAPDFLYPDTNLHHFLRASEYLDSLSELYPDIFDFQIAKWIFFFHDIGEGPKINGGSIEDLPTATASSLSPEEREKIKIQEAVSAVSKINLIENPEQRYFGFACYSSYIGLKAFNRSALMESLVQDSSIDSERKKDFITIYDLITRGIYNVKIDPLMQSAVEKFTGKKIEELKEVELHGYPLRKEEALLAKIIDICDARRYATYVGFYDDRLFADIFEKYKGKDVVGYFEQFIHYIQMFRKATSDHGKNRVIEDILMMELVFSKLRGLKEEDFTQATQIYAQAGIGRADHSIQNYYALQQCFANAASPVINPLTGYIHDTSKTLLLSAYL